MKAIWELLRDSFNKWQQDNAPRLAAALTYYTIFSITPVIIIALAVAGAILGPQAARGALYLETVRFVGDAGAKVIQELVENAAKPDTSLIASVIGVVGLILASSGLFAELQAALNLIWGIHIDPPKAFLMGVMRLIRDRLLAFALVLGAGALLLVFSVLSTMISALGNVISGVWSSGSNYVIQAFTFVATSVVMAAIFAVIFKVLPDALVTWGDVWIGAAFTAFLLNIGWLLIGLYLSTSSIATAYGAAGSFIVILVWVNFSAQIFYMGAEFTQVYANKYGSHILAIQHTQTIGERQPHHEQ